MTSQQQYLTESQNTDIQLLNHPSLLKLAQMQNIALKKSQILTDCCLAQNQYGIYSKKENGQIDSNATFQCAEVSNFFSRYCAPGDCRNFKIMISDYSHYYRDELFKNNIFLEFDRPFKCTFFNFSRPVMNVNLSTSSGKINIGKIFVPFYCCHRQIAVEVFDSNNAKKFTIQDSGCQCITCCTGCFCSDKCKQGEVKVYDQGYSEQKPLTIKSKGCCLSCCLALNDKEFSFPHLSSVSDKILLIAALLMFDMNFLECIPERRRFAGTFITE